MERRLYLTALVIFLIAAALTLSSARQMGGGMSMPGGWTMGMTWMQMSGQGRLDAAGMFAIMWLTMMVAMMLPSALPMLLLCRRLAIHRGETSPDTLVWLMAAAYFGVWTVFGIVAYIAGAMLGEAAMRSESISRAIPATAGAALVVAGIYQLTPWKAACLRHCRNPLALASHHLERRGWRGVGALGAHHGLFCIACCWALMVMQLVLGVMNLGVMIAVATVIALEKLTPRGAALARTAGVAAIAGGVSLVARVALD